MKKIFFFTAMVVTLAFIVSCEEDEGKLPEIKFKTASSYVSSDRTVGQGDTLYMGIDAKKTEDKDVLKTFDVSKSYDGGATTSILSESLSGSQGDFYSKDIMVVTRTQAGTEKYTFTVVNRDGLKNSVSVTLTVQ